MSARKTLALCVILIGIVFVMLYHFKDDTVTDTVFEDDVVTINVWYTDDALTDYLNSAAVAYLDEYGVRVVPELHTGLEYIEEINDASVSSNCVPDLYVIGTDSLAKAAMAGLALPVLDEKNVLNQMHYPDVAINAVTYEGEKFGYPFYYETAVLLYNETYLRMMADSTLRNEIAGSETDVSGNEVITDETTGTEVSVSENMAPPEGYSEEEWNAAVDAKVSEMIPASVEDILNFANTYSAPPEVENIFLWDVSDIFYNYFFAGKYMNVGGIYGDDAGIIDIYNDDTVACMQVYQGLNEFFSIDASQSSYEEVLDTFINGKTIFMIATTDAFAAIDEATFNGEFTWDYSVAALPGVDAEHEAQGLSSTSAAVVNGYTLYRNEADGFARFITYEYVDSFYDRTGKLATVVGEEDYVTDVTDLARDMYKESIPLPKLIELSNFWIELELAYTLIWEGEDVTSTLSALQDKMQQQVE